jgi:hypothetical protein
MDTGWTRELSEFESRQGQEFSFPHVVQTGFKAHPISYPLGTGNFSVGDKAAGVWRWPLVFN